MGLQEKKLTDEEIVKALDNCVNGDYKTKCKGCPYDEKADYCKVMDRDTLDLINRQKTEIERLTEEKNDWEKSCKLWSGANKSNHLKFTRTLEKLCEERNKNAELQKQVDELKKENEKAYEIERANIQAEIAEAGTSCHWCKQQAVKDTAKEILDEVSKHYGGAWLVELYKRYGVEVE